MGEPESNSSTTVSSDTMVERNDNDTISPPPRALSPRSPHSLSSDARVAFAPVVRMRSQSSNSSNGSGVGPRYSRQRSHSQRSDRSCDPEPGIWRRMTRAPTLYTIDTLDPDEDSEDNAPNWEPGSEPAADTTGGPLVWCRFTVVEFSQDNVRTEQSYNNHSFCKFLEQPQDEWVKCRWISVMGVSQDVVKALGDKYALHELATEDLLEDQRYSRIRTKADWYPTHAFISLTLQWAQKTVYADAQENGGATRPAKGGGISALMHRLRKWRQPVQEMFDNEPDLTPMPATHIPEGYSLPREPQTLQQYHSLKNTARSRYMESVSALLPQRSVVMAERVSLFLTNDNTVISFFESRAEDIEKPILRRISTRGTVLRESCDASLVVQAIIDTIVDMALPLTQKYAEAIDDLELEVLSKAEIEQTEQLYICISEINKMLTFLNPIDNMVNVIRDHKTDMSQAEALLHLQDPSTGVIITPMTTTYLGDILDHCIMVTEALAQLKQSSENLINLIFNKTAAVQNDTMQLLTYVTIFFLPLTFITGFFGQNFLDFPELAYGMSYFWKVSGSTAGVTIMLMLWPRIAASARSAMKRRFIADDRIKHKRNRQLLREARTQTMRNGGL
jgi:Mg2+ and Co2+ transporter CorA